MDFGCYYFLVELIFMCVRAETTNLYIIQMELFAYGIDSIQTCQRSKQICSETVYIHQFLAERK